MWMVLMEEPGRPDALVGVGYHLSVDTRYQDCGVALPGRTVLTLKAFTGATYSDLIHKYQRWQQSEVYQSHKTAVRYSGTSCAVPETRVEAAFQHEGVAGYRLHLVAVREQ